MSLKIAVMAGDGVGVEVTAEALKVLAAAAAADGVAYETTEFGLGGGHYLQTGEVISDEQVEQLKQFDAILVGAVGRPDVKPGIIERGLLLRLRFEFDQYINLRPVRLYEGVKTPLAGRSPADINFTVIRENTEDLYCGNGGTMRRGTAAEISTQEMLATRFGVERCLRYAFEHCLQRKQAGVGRGELTLVHKTNVLTFCGDTWHRAFEQIGQADYPQVARQYHHVDACCMYMVTQPQIYDTIVSANMFGDIITDLGAAIAGGMGVAASGNLNPDPAAGLPRMFEPVHGSAPDIAGTNQANPIAAILSVAMLLQETGRVRNDQPAAAAGQRVEQAVIRTCPQFANQSMDRLNVGTTEVGDMVIAAL